MMNTASKHISLGCVNICKEKCSIFKRTIILGDVDNDGDNELIFGTIHGSLFIFKHSLTHPWKSCQDLGTICSLTFGDLLLNGFNSLFVFVAEGHCYLFDRIDSTEKSPVLNYTVKITVPYNISSSMIWDIDGDGHNELVVSTYDRAFYSYHLVKETNPSTDTEPQYQLNKKKDWTLNSQIEMIKPIKYSHLENKVVLAAAYTESLEYLLLGIDQKFRSYHFFNKSPPGVLVSPDPENDSNSSNSSLNSKEKEENLVYKKTNELLLEYIDSSDCLAIVTAYGDLVVKNIETLENIQHKIKVTDSTAISIQSLDVNRDGKKEIILCTWNGSTFILNSDFSISRFDFCEEITTFKAGLFSVAPGKNVPSFFYVTADNTLFGFCDLHINTNPPMSLLNILETDPIFFEAFKLFKNNPDEEEFSVSEKLLMLKNLLEINFHHSHYREYYNQLVLYLQSRKKISIENKQTHF